MEQYGYTYIIRYKYNEEDGYRQDFYCTNNYELAIDSQELIDYFNIEDGDIIEIVYQIANDFNSNDYLSDGAIYCLNRNLNSEFVDTQMAYISFVISNLYGDERTDYIRNIVTALLKELKRKSINKYAISTILRLLGKDFEANRGTFEQLELIIKMMDEGWLDDILSKLAPLHKKKQLKYQLDKLDKYYHIQSETSQRRVGILMLVFSEYTTLMYDSIKGNLSELTRLLSDYYKISPPKYRVNDLREYIDPNTHKNLYKTIKNEHIEFWDNLQ